MKTWLLSQSLYPQRAGVNWPDFGTGWKPCFLPFSDGANFLVWTDRTLERDENNGDWLILLAWLDRCELTGLWNGMKTLLQNSNLSLYLLLVWTDRTLERDENIDFIGLRSLCFLKVWTDRTLERDENIINLHNIPILYLVWTDRTLERDENESSSSVSELWRRVWTDRTLERDENYMVLHYLKYRLIGVNWPDFGTGWKPSIYY